MKCKIFTGAELHGIDAFNKWAKGKALTHEVIIHELLIREEDEHENAEMAIIVYHPEGEH